MEVIPFRVLNLNNKPKILDKGDAIATCEPVVDIVARPREFSGAQHLPSTLEILQILNEEQRTAVRNLINEFQKLFSTCDADVGRCNMTQHRINTGDHPPIKQYPRCLPLVRKEEADNLVTEMSDNGIIEESSGHWASPIVLVKKKDGSTGFCVDYRKLNEITKNDNYLLIRIDDTLYTLNGTERVQTDPEKIKAVVDWPRPETVHDLQSFLRLCTYYRRFGKHFSTTGRTLHKLNEAKSSFNWTGECEKSFNSLKQGLTSSTILTYPRTDKDFILDTDASNEGIGAVLSQNIGNEERVIAYFSKSLGKPERNYCVIRKELLAIVKSIEHFHHYIYE
ncbi:Retrovirus-related Pol polyprotein from transposon opus [Araneus ventricosus]|uniref:RNA-directed DNA polymerase n=1 Tax=Araneus ventricosus TaxID=182803 RepID=A0A4Y2JGZ2_ARAVE|nr:Retrovirus-related Pol polyprotein from transposon opus [Araneus ventricosus]